MSKSKKLGFIGFGNMASAIANGILNAGILKAQDMAIFDINADKAAPLIESGALMAESAADVAKNSEFVLLAVKPQNLPEILPQLKEFANDSTVFISIVAGFSDAGIKKVLGEQAKLVMVMPNTPILVGHGTVALSFLPPTSREEFDFVLKLFSAAGEAMEIQGNLMNEVIPLNGSAPAFIYYITKVFVDRAIELGFSLETANRLFCTTLIGAAEMMLNTGMDHQQLIDMVSSKGGTTVKALDTMKETGLSESLRAGIDACIQRAYELGLEK